MLAGSDRRNIQNRVDEGFASSFAAVAAKSDKDRDEFGGDGKDPQRSAQLRIQLHGGFPAGARQAGDIHAAEEDRQCHLIDIVARRNAGEKLLGGGE